MNEMIAAAKSGRGKGNAYARMKAEWTTVVEMHARSQPRETVRPGPVWILCVWAEKDERRDPDNVFAAVKFILDGLVAAKAIKGDGHKHIGRIEHHIVTDKERPGVTVSVQYP